MQNQNSSISRRELLKRFVQINAVQNNRRLRSCAATCEFELFRDPIRPLIGTHSSLAKVHQHDIHGQAVKPRRKRRLTAESLQLAVELKKNILREIFKI